MSYRDDYDCSDKGSVLEFNGHRTAIHDLPPGQGLQVLFRAAAGEVTINVLDLERGVQQPKRNPGSTSPRTDSDLTRTRTDPSREIGAISSPLSTVPAGDEGAGTESRKWLHVPLRVELIPPAGAAPVASWSIPEKSDYPGIEFKFTVGGPGAPEGDWTCRILNPTQKRTAECNLSVRHTRDHVKKGSRDVPLRLLNHAFSTALEALAPAAKVDGNLFYVSFGAELREYFGNPCGGGVLGTYVKQLPDGAYASGKLLGVRVTATDGATMLKAVDDQAALTTKVLNGVKEATAGGKLATALANLDKALSKETEDVRGAKHVIEIISSVLSKSGNLSYIDNQIAAVASWKTRWHQRVSATDPVIHAELVATDINADFYAGPVHLDGGLANVTIDMYCAFNPELRSADVFFVTPAKFTGWLADLLDWLGELPPLSKLLNDYLAPPIQQAAPALGRYLGEVLVALVRRGDIFWRVTASGNKWRVEYCREPLDVGQSETRVPAGIVTPPHGIGPVRPAGLSSATPFVDPDPEMAPRLQRIKTIVVLMMENRSFDHTLGHLAKTYGPKYEGLHLDGRETNPPAPPLINPIQMAPAPSTQIPISPHHEYENVLRQVADGQMSGFTTDIADIGDPQFPMTYYTAAELPAYYQLADSFCVCDHWFSAHPGPTFPNRFATVMGTIPDPDSLPTDDPRLGTLPDQTIFDVLSLSGIQWRYFESDVSFLRMFNAHRLDDQNVIPYNDEKDGFKAYLESGSTDELRVIFIDPNFVNIPPVATANDDHPPADLASGQRFVAEVYNTLLDSKRWPNTLFVVTYDEHGGFYDHVPPPGTLKGPPELVGKYPLLHPKGKHYLGVRVPAFLISPWVTAGSVCQRYFDHTSIIKTILVRFRDQIAAPYLSSLGPRVNSDLIPHVGIALNTSARTVKPNRIDLARVELARRASLIGRTPARSPRLSETQRREFSRVLRKAFAPRPQPMG